jgi:hypothetical protein
MEKEQLKMEIRNADERFLSGEVLKRTSVKLNAYL